MAEILRQRQKQEEINISRQQTVETTRTRQAGMPMQETGYQQQIPAEILKKLEGLPIQIPKNMYQGEAVRNYEEMIASPYHELNMGTFLVDRKLQFREFHQEKEGQA